MEAAAADVGAELRFPAMANEYRETRDVPGDHADLFAAVLEAATRCRWKVRSSDARAGTITARTSFVSMRGGGERIQIWVADERVTCDSRTWSPVALSDLGKNRANVERFFEAVLAVRGGLPQDAGRLRSLATELSQRIAPSAATWAPPQPADPPAITQPQEAAPPAVPATGAAAEPQIDRVRFEDPVVETMWVDDIPVDNRHGKRELEIETEVRYTLRLGVTFDETETVRGDLGLDVKFLSGTIGAEAARQRSVRSEEEITKSYKASFTAAAGEHLIYQVVWRRRVHPGEVDVRIGPTTHHLPFRFVADLEYGVTTKPGIA